MKRLFAFVLSILTGIFLLNSFVLKDKDAAKVIKNKLDQVNIVLISNDAGQTWQNISAELSEMKRDGKIPVWEKQKVIVRAKGILIATGVKGIKQSTDDGKHWQWAISEGGKGIAIERIEGGFAAITYNRKTKSRRLRISLDSGKTWQAIDKGLPPSMFISSIKQMGKYLICSNMSGIFRSADMGKTWKKVFCGVNNNDNNNEFKFSQTWNSPPRKNVFRLHISGNVLYAVAVPAGC